MKDDGYEQQPSRMLTACTLTLTRDSKWVQERELECKHLLYVHMRVNKQLGRLHGCLQNAKEMLQHSLAVCGDFLCYLLRL